ncbi:extracellular catalytic domain type 1 short-chain-length polyhydroxyalkanoate depolymerase [Psychrobacter fulvigenes]|uniref:extracellular catalytic domain type 1 short-chain-length polyhydroxyalkanoate depolymerase n=1 Tax=Psychrobacter fulvigenes TaxID=533323 RepID=UPI00191979AF|nr:PHB depolymerase family esterase [Psychrobacter fulvigenes]
MDFSKFNMTPPHLKEAMELMKSGRLKEATTLIQNNLSGNVSDSNTTDNTSNANTMKDVTPDRPTLQDSATTKKAKPTEKVKSVKKENMANTEELASKSSNKLPESLQSLTDKIKNFKLDLPSAMDISGIGAGLNTHIEPTIPENAQFLKGTFKSSQGSHDYRLYIPSNYSQAVEQSLQVPLIVMLHGCTQSPEDFAVGTRMNELAEEHQCLIVYPSQPASANPNRCWNWFRPTDQQQGQGEPAWLAELTRSVVKDYAVDPSRVYIAGLSAGAAMAVIMAETYPELYAAIGVHSGLAYRSATNLPSALMTMRKGSTSSLNLAPNHKFVPMIVFHGDQDQTVNIRNGEQIVEQAKLRLQAQKTILDRQQHEIGSKKSYRITQLKVIDDKGLNQLEYWKIHGAGHNWAGGSSAGSYTDPKGPDASKEMMRFFLQHEQTTG